jgi:hypothetical protein
VPPRNYTRGDRAALILLGRGKCYWGPGCNEPVLKKVENRYRLNLQIAHIRSDVASEERYVPDYPPSLIDAFENLIFLCKPHHETIDEPGAGERFTIELLEAWKEEREEGNYDKLRGLHDVTEDALVDRIASAFSDQSEDIRATLARLEVSDAQAADLIRELTAEINSLRSAGPVIDPDVVARLSMAAQDLAHLETSASILSQVVTDARGLGDVATRLQNAVDEARTLN